MGVVGSNDQLVELLGVCGEDDGHVDVVDGVDGVVSFIDLFNRRVLCPPRGAEQCFGAVYGFTNQLLCYCMGCP